MENQALGLYIHIPYCINKCGYCDFNSHPIKYDEMEAYVDALIVELNYYAKKYSPERIVNTIFLGGGTPTTLSVSQLERILKECERNFKIATDAEITIEANPATIRTDQLKSIRQTGYNRISVGVQSFDKTELKMLDRAHGPDYRTNSPLAQMQRAERVSPAGNEPLIFYTDALDAYLKPRGIDTLLYTGFATDMCVLNAEGGARPMLSRDYRCILIRDATVGVETPQSFSERLATRYGIHIFEWQLGYSTTFKAFLDAVSGVH